MKLEKLTESEKKFVEENHNLVYGFLHTYKYSIEEWYSVVIFGFLKSVQVYHRRKDLQNKYDFPFIAWQYMKSEIGNYFRKQNSQKRKPAEPTVSLDAEYYDMENFYNCVGGKSAEDDVMEKIFLAEILGNLSKIQRKIAELKIDGYNNKEVCLILQIPSSTFYQNMRRIKITINELLENESKTKDIIRRYVGGV